MEDEQTRRLPRARVLAVAVVLLCVVGGLVGWHVVSNRAERELRSLLSREAASPVVVDPEEESRIVAFCSDCHGMPRPENYPRHAWRKEVLRGYEFYARSGRNDLDPPPIDLTITYYQARAPLEPVFADPKTPGAELNVEFAAQTFAAEPSANLSPAVSCLRWTRLDDDAAPILLACDMRQGTVVAIDPADRASDVRVLAQLHHPCHLEPCDVDGDGAMDLVVADLGSLYGVDDHDRGRIVLLQREKETGVFREVILASGLGRVCDVRPADVDADGDVDLIVADFGAYRPGGIFLLRNASANSSQIRFEREEIDRRPGTVHVPVCDLNDDGRPDFLALVSQDHECVDAFINQGDGQFRLRTIWWWPDPAFGLSGMELLDLDQDGDLDVLFTNGDSFDDGYVKPCHGVHWLENRGELKFVHHRLTDLPGAYRALAGDIDLDGDMDVVASVWIEPKIRFVNTAVKRWDSLVCLEQTSPGKFVHHSLETDFPWHPTMELADFDGDGDLDLAVGSHARKPTLRLPHWLSIWWNEGTSTEK